MAPGRPTAAAIAAGAEERVGLDARMATDDKAAGCARGNRRQYRNGARASKLSGTPAFVVGNQLLPGAVGYDALKKAIAEARAAKR